MAKHQVVGRASRKGISHKIKRIAALAISRWPSVVDFVSVRPSQIHKLHQVLSRNLLILREDNRVGNLVPNRVPAHVDIC
jgi:hypothetical protein